MRAKWRYGLVLAMVVGGVGPAAGGMPRDVVLMADSQDGDVATGVTVARGHAELRSDTFHIVGRATIIEINPKRNEVYFTGGADVTVNGAVYRGERVLCSLDFDTCAAVSGGAVDGAGDGVALQPAVTPMPLEGGRASMMPW